MRQETKVVTGGRHPERFGGAVNTPVIRTSTVVAETVADWNRMDEPDYDGMIYGRLGTPTVWSLEEAVAELEGGDRSFAYPSGLAANVGAVVAFVSAGDHVLLTDSVYGPVRRFMNNVLSRMGVEVSFFDPLAGASVKEHFRPHTKVVYVESPGSLTFEMQDIPAIAAEAHKIGAVVLMDNTWGTPLYYKPFEHGVDVSIQSATKYIVGHSDVMMGLVTAKSEHAPKVQRCRQDFGLIPGPDDSYLALRGLRTMHVRLAQHQKSALALADLLAGSASVERMLCPQRPGDPGHDLWKRDFTGACGLFGVVFKPMSKKALAAFIDAMPLFAIGASWGGYESLVMQVHPEKARTVSPWTDKGPVIRFHAGLENIDDLLENVEAGLTALGKAL
ncbi:cystathionine beta-lyase [Martelella sp. HB161492]|uniref:cystathionine beta-lyase n=1 Tax=Martelella sp. HB161492 TaxID=2720726 RepID=UPI00159242E4|nr:cystathionine beta-lyase [Martelella sp. HB161492]